MPFQPKWEYINTGLEVLKDGRIVKKKEEGGARKYTGNVATGYDEKREKSAKWIEENEIIHKLLEPIPDGSWVLDAPIGTGRFLAHYAERGFLVNGLDLSEDMLKIAHDKAPENITLNLFKGSVTDLEGLLDKCVDVTVMVRVSRWLSPDEFIQALLEAGRVTRKRIITTARVRNHPHARTHAMINAALVKLGWEIREENPLPSDPDYVAFALEPKKDERSEPA